MPIIYQIYTDNAPKTAVNWNSN